MKRFEVRSKEVVTEERCVHLQCELCGRVAEHPSQELFEWGGVGTASGKLNWHFEIDGDYQAEETDLCYECADALGDAIAMLSIKEKLLELIDRQP